MSEQMRPNSFYGYSNLEHYAVSFKYHTPRFTFSGYVPYDSSEEDGHRVIDRILDRLHAIDNVVAGDGQESYCFEIREQGSQKIIHSQSK